MTLVELINKTKEIASRYTLVRTAMDGDIYDNIIGHDIRYGAFNVDIESIERDNQATTVGLVVYYADRLLQSKSNALQVKDDAVNLLQSVLFQLKKEKSIINMGDFVFTPFEQKFDDYLAGAWARVNVTMKSSVSKCGMGNPYVYEIPSTYLTLRAVGEGEHTVAMNKYGPSSYTVDIQYSLDEGRTFEDWDRSPITIQSGKCIVFRGNNESIGSDYGHNSIRFVFSTGDLWEASGSVMSLLDGGSGTRTDVGDWEFYGLFQNCTSLIKAPELPATTLGIGCYYNMFNNTSIVESPILDAETATYMSYYVMFRYCRYLKKVTMLATTIEYEATDGWLLNTPAGGTLVLNANRTSDPQKPATWTLVEV